MRNRLARLASLLAVAALVAAGCGGPAAPPDAYEQLNTSLTSTWSPIQVNVGVKVTAAGQTITIDPKAIAFVVDTAAAKFAFHMSLPGADLGMPAGALDALGIAGDSIDFDVIYAADALYMRSAMLKPTLRLILRSKVPAGDLTGWLKLGTKEELMALQALSGGLKPQSSFAPPSSGPGAMKASFEAAGITLTDGGPVKHNGADARHITIAVDIDKLVADPSFRAGAGPQSGPTIAVMRSLSFAGDLWIDPANNRIVEADAHVTSIKDPTQVGDVTITAHDPDGSVALDAPTSSVDVPLGTLISEMMKLIGKGAES